MKLTNVFGEELRLDGEASLVIVHQCAYCGVFTRVSPGEDAFGVSHGVCQQCKEALLAEMKNQ